MSAPFHLDGQNGNGHWMSIMTSWGLKREGCFAGIVYGIVAVEMRRMEWCGMVLLQL